MAKKAKAITVSVGRNFLNVAALGNFLESDEAKQLDAKMLRNVADTHGRFLKDFTTIEVNVVEVWENLGVCIFHIRGPLVHQVVAPAHCLEFIKPVVGASASKQDLYREFDRLVNVG